MATEKLTQIFYLLFEIRKDCLQILLGNLSLDIRTHAPNFNIVQNVLHYFFVRARLFLFFYTKIFHEKEYFLNILEFSTRVFIWSIYSIKLKIYTRHTKSIFSFILPSLNESSLILKMIPKKKCEKKKHITTINSISLCPNDTILYVKKELKSLI